MYGDQFGEFVCVYWGLKGQTGVHTILDSFPCRHDKLSSKL